MIDPLSFVRRLFVQVPLLLVLPRTPVDQVPIVQPMPTRRLDQIVAIFNDFEPLGKGLGRGEIAKHLIERFEQPSEDDSASLKSIKNSVGWYLNKYKGVAFQQVRHGFWTLENQFRKGNTEVRAQDKKQKGTLRPPKQKPHTTRMRSTAIFSQTVLTTRGDMSHPRRDHSQTPVFTQVAAQIPISIATAPPTAGVVSHPRATHLFTSQNSLPVYPRGHDTMQGIHPFNFARMTHPTAVAANSPYAALEVADLLSPGSELVNGSSNTTVASSPTAEWYGRGTSIRPEIAPRGLAPLNPYIDRPETQVYGLTSAARRLPYSDLPAPPINRLTRPRYTSQQTPNDFAPQPDACSEPPQQIVYQQFGATEPSKDGIHMTTSDLVWLSSSGLQF